MQTDPDDKLIVHVHIDKTPSETVFRDTYVSLCIRVPKSLSKHDSDSFRSRRRRRTPGAVASAQLHAKRFGVQLSEH